MNRFGLPVRIAIAAGLTGWLLWYSHPSTVIAVLQGAAWEPIAGAVLLVLADRALMAYRWLVLLCIVDPTARPPRAAVMKIFFVSTFVGTFLPASIGGDVVRAYSATRLNVPGGDAVASVFIDRMMGVASVLIMALAGLLLAQQSADSAVILVSLAVAATACAATLLLVFGGAAANVVARPLRWLPGAAGRLADALLTSVRRYAGHRTQLVNVLAGSVAVQVLRTLQAYLLGRGLGITAPVEAYFAFVPLILLVMLLPITFNGIGTSQAAFVYFFAQAGVAIAPAFALSVLFVALGVVGNLPGAVLYLVGDGEVRRPTPHHRKSQVRQGSGEE